MIRIIFLLGIVLTVIAVAEDADHTDQYPKFSPYGYTDLELGQIVRGRCINTLNVDSTYTHSWLQNVHGRLGLRYQPCAWLDLRTGFEVRMWFNTFPNELTILKNVPRDRYWSIYLHEAQGVFQLLNRESWFMHMAVGYFPYKYNPEVRDLGEYLFRTGTYPAYIINYYDVPFARLAGLCYTAGYTHTSFNLQLDVLGISETNMWPYHDLTVASIVGCNILPDKSGTQSIFSIGAGISLAHIWPVDKEIATPLHERDYSTYKIDTTGWHLNPADSLDTLWDIDKSLYTFKGTKVMARVTIDPVAFLRGRESVLGDLFGQNGGKLYGELAVIGLKDYPANAANASDSANKNPFGYDDIRGKMPMMFGVTIPCWKILDICALELEYFNCPYPNDYSRVYRERLPLPGKIQVGSDGAYTYTLYENGDNWKWALFMKKSIGNHVGIILQICRDHQRWEYSGHQDNWDFEEAMVRKDHWAWNFKTEYAF